MSLDVQVNALQAGPRVLMRQQRLHVPAGQVLTLMGPSGCGKSSLLAAIAGLGQTLAPEGVPALRFDGEVWLNGQAVGQWPTMRRGIGLLFQDALLFPHMSVADNLLFAVPPGPRAQRLAAVQAALAEAGLPDSGPRDPATLSGGQRARVALLRALLAQPRALLLDEPFSRLDAGLRAQFRAWVFDQVRQRQLPAILVTHDRADMADPGWLMEWPDVG